MILAGCSEYRSNQQLLGLERLAYESPVSALDSLRTINREQLLDVDRHLYDFLMVKVSDKAYVTHTSDSLILKVIDHEARHKKNGRYAEALYYGARVYSDMGDYPTSMQYYQRALDALAESPDNLDLEANISSQYGRLLNSLRLYSEAIPFVERSLEIDRVLNDSVNEVYDLQLLGYVKMRQDDLKSAEMYFSEAVAKSMGMKDRYRAKSAILLATVKNELGQTDSALNLIRDVPSKVSAVARNNALAAAARIYLDAGIADTAYLYAHELICANDEINKANGYAILLSPRLIGLTENSDTLRKYMEAYRDVVESIYDDNDNRLALEQQSLYNYKIHVIEKEKGQRRNVILTWVVSFSVVCCLILILMILVQKYRDKEKIIQLQKALAQAGKVEQSLKSVGETHDEKSSATDKSILDGIITPSGQDTESELRKVLREKLLRISESYDTIPPVSTLIINSDAYSKLRDAIEKNVVLKDNDNLWEEIENVVLQCSPLFKKNLRLLAGGRLSSYDLKTAMLIKCGASNSEMAILFGRVKGTIVSRRESLCKRVFDQKLGTQTIDRVIRLL